MDKEIKAFCIYSTLKELFAGTMSGIAQVLVGQPFDIAKVRMQTQSKKNQIYNNSRDCIKKIFKNEGLLAFYKGSLSPLLGVGAAVSIQFGANEAVKRFLKGIFNLKDPIPFQIICISGAIAGVLNCIVCIPVEHFRIRMQIQTKENKIYTGSIDAALKIYQKYGLYGVYKGSFPGMLRAGIGISVYFTTYDLFISYFLNENLLRGECPAYLTLIGGGISGAICWTACYPLDIIKTKIQADNLNKPKYKNSMQVFNEIKATGYKEFYRGFTPCLIRTIPVNAVGFYCFEKVMKYLR